MSTTAQPKNQYAEVECQGCLDGEDCYGWTTEDLKCPSRIPADRDLETYFDSVREFEDEQRVGAL